MVTAPTVAPALGKIGPHLARNRRCVRCIVMRLEAERVAESESGFDAPPAIIPMQSSCVHKAPVLYTDLAKAIELKAKIDSAKCMVDTTACGWPKLSPLCLQSNVQSSCSFSAQSSASTLIGSGRLYDIRRAARSFCALLLTIWPHSACSQRLCALDVLVAACEAIRGSPSHTPAAEPFLPETRAAAAGVINLLPLLSSLLCRSRAPLCQHKAGAVLYEQ
jgi:hypothetical protein